MGTRKLYDFIDDNPLFHFMRIENINDPAIVKQNHKVGILTIVRKKFNDNYAGYCH